MYEAGDYVTHPRFLIAMMIHLALIHQVLPWTYITILGIRTIPYFFR